MEKTSAMRFKVTSFLLQDLSLVSEEQLQFCEARPANRRNDPCSTEPKFRLTSELFCSLSDIEERNDRKANMHSRIVDALEIKMPKASRASGIPRRLNIKPHYVFYAIFFTTL